MTDAHLHSSYQLRTKEKKTLTPKQIATSQQLGLRADPRQPGVPLLGWVPGAELKLPEC